MSQVEQKQTKGNGLTGLVNCGNTCYLNTCLQILSHTQELNNILDGNALERHLKKNSDGVLLHEWNELRKLMWSEDCVVRPLRFLKIVHSVARQKNKLLFTGWSQNDTSEFYQFVMESFHDALSREVKMSVKGAVRETQDQLADKCYKMMIDLYQKSYSEFLNPFFGIQVWRTDVIKGGQTVVGEVEDMRPEPFMSIELPLDGVATSTGNQIDLLDALHAAMVPEQPDGFVDKDGNQKERSLRFWSTPDVLLVNLKRYNALGRKIRTNVAPAEELDLSEYCIGYTRVAKYELYGAAIHMGSSIQGGHYFAIIKVNGDWYCFNDTNISKISSGKDFAKAAQRLGDASCFFYRKK